MTWPYFTVGYCTLDGTDKQRFGCHACLVAGNAIGRHGRPHIRGKLGQLTPWKMDETLKKLKHAKKSIFSEYFERIRAGRCRERRYAADHIFIQIYFRMHHFVVKFSKISSPQAARGHWSPNQNPADPPVGRPWSKDGFTPNVTFFLRWPRLAGSIHA